MENCRTQLSEEMVPCCLCIACRGSVVYDACYLRYNSVLNLNFEIDTGHVEEWVREWVINGMNAGIGILLCEGIHLHMRDGRGNRFLFPHRSPVCIWRFCGQGSLVWSGQYTMTLAHLSAFSALTSSWTEDCVLKESAKQPFPLSVFFSAAAAVFLSALAQPRQLLQ